MSPVSSIYGVYVSLIFGLKKTTVFGYFFLLNKI